MSCWDRGPPVEKFSSKWGGGSAQRNQGQKGKENLLLREHRDLTLTTKHPPASVGLTKDNKTLLASHSTKARVCVWRNSLGTKEGHEGPASPDSLSML